MGEQSKLQVYLTHAEAMGLALLLWQIAEDPATNHDRKVSAIGAAAILESRAGIPGAPTHTEVSRKRAKFFQAIRNKLSRNLARRGRVVEPTIDISENIEEAVLVELIWAPSVAWLLWDVVSDKKAHNRDVAAHFACLLEDRIETQLEDYEFDDDDETFYRNIVAFLDAEVEELKQLGQEQRKNRPVHWKPVAENDTEY